MRIIEFSRLPRIASLMAIMLAGFAVFGQTNTADNKAKNPPPAPRRPSIIFILADDLGYGDLGCYGQTQIKTPNIDRLATEGIRFTSFYAGSAVCAPSRAALMLGNHTGHLNIRGNAKGLSLKSEELTVAKLLQNSGYWTGLIGKWGLGDHDTPGVPQKQGFNTFAGFLDQTHAHDYYPDYIWRYATESGAAVFDDKMPLLENAGGKQRLYVHDLFTEAALNFIKINKPDSINKQRPFFLFLAYTIPHANNEESQRTGNGMQVPSNEPYRDEPWTLVERGKAAMITRLDRDVGRILDRLKQLHIDDNTVVFFASDNGPHKEGGVDPKFFNSAGPLRGIKRDLYEGGIRVPMIVRWPARIKPGQVSDFPWAMWDVLPTAAQIAMLEPPRNIDGLSVFPLLTGKPQTNRHDFFYWEFHERGFQQAVRIDDWKAVRPQAGEPLELYDLKKDLGEKKNVAAENPEVVAKIEKYLKTARAESDRWPIKGPPKKSDDKSEGKAVEKK
jgi:arylsulfatase A-like enzyme